MFLTLKDQVTSLAERAGLLNIDEFLAILAQQFPGEVTFSTSFSFEDQLITHKILNNQLPIKIFTLDTGRLFPETYSVWNSTNERYNTHIKAYYPDDFKNLSTLVGL